MTDFGEVLLYVFAWLGSEFWCFDLFGHYWSISFLQLWLFPVYGSIVAYIIKRILSTRE